MSMETREMLWQVFQGNSAERQQARQALTDNAARNIHYANLLKILAGPDEDRVTFWVLDVLIKHFADQLRRDADHVVPLLLGKLQSGSVIPDRAALALKCVGEPAVAALLAAIAAAPDTAEAARYTGALRHNPEVHLHALQVISLLAGQLNSPNEEVSYCSLMVLMDIGPLRPWFDERMVKADFEAVYPQLLATAKRFAASRYGEFVGRYVQLLNGQLNG